MTARVREAGMILFLFLTPLTIAGSEIALGIAAAAWLAGAWWARRAERSAGRAPAAGALAGPALPILPALLALAAAWALASAGAYDRGASFAKMQKLLLAGALFLFATAPSGARLRGRLAAALAAGCAATSLYGIAAYLRGTGGLVERLRGVSGFYMTTAGILMLAILFILPLLLTPIRLVARALLAAALALTGWALVLTYTRGAWLGTLAGAALIAAVMNRKLLVAGLVLAGASYFVLPAELRERVRSIPEPSYYLNSERVQMWRAGWRLVRDHPLTGAGLMDMKPLFARYVDPSYAGVIHGHFHSNWVQMAAASGLLGLAAFVALLASACAALVRARRAARSPAARALALGGLAALAGFVVQGFFEWNFGDAEVVTLWYALTGLALSAGAPEAPEPSGRPAAFGAPGAAPPLPRGGLFRALRLFE